MMKLCVVMLLVAGRDAGPPRDLWDFDGLTAKVAATGQANDELGALALGQLGIALQSTVALEVSAHPNTVGGVTLTLKDPQNPKVSCALYAAREGEVLTFKDGRCTFPAFTGQARTSATCRRISGSARRVKDTIAVDAVSPDCTAQPMGMPLSVRATVKPL